LKNSIIESLHGGLRMARTDQKGAGEEKKKSGYHYQKNKDG